MDIADLERAIGQVLRRGMANGFMTVQALKSHEYLELRKYFSPYGVYGLYLCIPVEQWSEDYIPLARKYFAAEGIRFFFERRESDGSISFLCVDGERDTHRTYKWVRDIFIDVFGVPQSAKLTAVLNNCSPWDELIESPHQKPLPWAQGKMEIESLVRKELGLPLWDLALGFALGCTQMVGIAGLAYSMAFDNDTRSWVDLEVLGTVIKAPVLGLFYWGLMLTGFFRIFTRFYWVKPAEKVARQRESISRIGLLFRGVRAVILQKLNLISIVISLIAIYFWNSGQSMN